MASIQIDYIPVLTLSIYITITLSYLT